MARRSRPSPRGNSRRPRRRAWKIPPHTPWILLCLLSLTALGFSVHLLMQERARRARTASLPERARTLAQEHPEAEVFNLDEPAPKKKVTPPSPPPPVKPAPPAASPAAPAPIPTPHSPDKPPPPLTSQSESTPAAPLPAPSPSFQVAKAEPVIAPAPESRLEIAAWQVRLERWHFSCGTIDGDFGMRSRRAITQFQLHHRLPVTGELDFETRYHLGVPGNPFVPHTVTAEELARIQPTPATWLAKSQAARLGYNDAWEMAAEDFHAAPGFLRELNPGVTDITPGTVLTVPNLENSLPLPKVDLIKIILPETTLLAYKEGRVMACFPCSIARDKNKRPNGQLLVKNFAPDPNYTFDPALFTEAAATEGITKKIILPPGPNNPVGVAWVGLSLPGYGIHGTPEPMDISRTGSSGCFRLANWNAQKLLQMIRTGIPVEIVE